MSDWLLLVEDEPDIQLIARASLRRAGFEVRTAASGLEALAAMATELPRAVVLDWHMPVLDGSATCVAMKDDSRTRDVPVIFLTARTDGEVHAQCRALGAIGCITKPFEPLRLGDQVKALLEGSVRREAKTA
jgi:DNA-binding response OmpR family regulator